MSTLADTKTTTAPALSEARRKIVIQRRVLLRAQLFRHLSRYLVVFVVLWASNFWVIREGGFWRPEKWWAFWPTFGWGFGVLTHGMSVFLSAYTSLPYVSVTWEEERVHEEMSAYRAVGGA